MHAIALLALLAACAGKTGSLDEPFTLAVGEQIRIAAARVTLGEVVEDSRCPEGAQCIWAGRARFAAVLAVGDEAVESEVALPGEALSASGYALELLEVQPRRTVGDDVASGEYAATLVLRGE